MKILPPQWKTLIFKIQAIPHNSKCRYGERGAADAKPKAQIILDAAKVSAASGGNSEPRQGQRSQSARGFCPRSTIRVPQPDIIEHFGNADAVPQPPERCLSRQAGIVRCCPKNSSARKLLKRPAIPSGCMNKIFFHISHLSLRTFANNQKVPIPQRHVIRRMWGGHFLFCDFIGARYFHRSGIKFSCRRCPRLGNHYLMNRLTCATKPRQLCLDCFAVIFIVRLFDQLDLLPNRKRLAAKMELQSGDRDKCFHREPPAICINCCVTNPTRP